MGSNFKEILTKKFILLNICFILGFSPVFLFLLLPIHLKVIGALEYQIGIAMGICSLGGLLTKPFIGKWIDIKGRRNITYLGFFISFCSLLPMLFSNSIPLFYFLRFLFGVGISFCMTTLYTTMLDNAPPQLLGQTVGLFGILNFIISGIATFIGELLLTKYSFNAIVLLSINNLFFSLVLFLFYKDKYIARERKGLPFFKTLIGPVKHFGIASLVFGAVHGVLFSFISVYLKEQGVKQVSFFFVFYSVGVVFMRIFFGYLVDRVSKSFIIISSLVLYGFVKILICIYPHSFIVFFFAFLGGISHGFLFPALSASIIIIIGNQWKGMGASIFLICFDLGLGVAPIIFGYFSGFLGYDKAFLYTAILLFLYTTIAYRPLKNSLN